MLFRKDLMKDLKIVKSLCYLVPTQDLKVDWLEKLDLVYILFQKITQRHRNLVLFTK